jgi:hypothetical protein
VNYSVKNHLSSIFFYSARHGKDPPDLATMSTATVDGFFATFNAKM